jgi:hypothetical protein
MQDIGQYEKARETLAMLKIFALGKKGGPKGEGPADGRGVR